jgi:hypothetical protein
MLAADKLPLDESGPFCDSGLVSACGLITAKNDVFVKIDTITLST